jgi:hypothetical protein
MQAARAPSGYSGTPLPAKLGLKDGMVAAFVALPATLEPLASAVRFVGLDRPADWAGIVGAARKYDCIHAFTGRHAEIEKHLADLQGAIKPYGMIWVSWPKKASKISTDVTEDIVRTEAFKLDLVDVKVAAIDETWSGLKLVVRKERRH